MDGKNLNFFADILLDTFIVRTHMVPDNFPCAQFLEMDVHSRCHFSYGTNSSSDVVAITAWKNVH